MSVHPEIETYLCREDIEKSVERLAGEITADYRDKNPLLIGVLTGSFIFLADLVRKLDIPVEVDFTRLCSYGSGTESSGNVKMTLEPAIPVTGRHVLVVEDIADTGYSLAFLMKYLEEKKPASLKLCVLMDKPSRRRVPVKIDYTGFTVPDEFLVGYGLDCDEKYRNIPEICILKETADDA
jgi:hypoxanthine phosphoribosyltransferase